MEYLKTLAHPDEALALLTLKYLAPQTQSTSPLSHNRKFIFDVLQEISYPTFLVVQQVRDEHVRDTACVLSLAVRALHAVAAHPGLEAEDKGRMLRNFATTLFTPGTCISGCGVGYEKHLMESFERVVDVALALKERMRNEVRSVVKRIGLALSESVHAPMDTTAQYEHYCRCTGGELGAALARLLAHEGPFADRDTRERMVALAASMGTMVAKTQHIVHFHADVQHGRVRWPRDVWGAYATSVDKLVEPRFAREALLCLNALCLNALQHLPDCLELLTLVQPRRNQFALASASLGMATSALADAFGNEQLFGEDTVMRRGWTAKMVVDTQDLDMVKRTVHEAARRIHARLPRAQLTDADEATRFVQDLLHVTATRRRHPPFPSLGDVVAVVSMVSSSLYLIRRHGPRLFSKL